MELRILSRILVLLVRLPLVLTIGIWIQSFNSLESQSASQCLFFDPVLIRITSLILSSALPGEDGRAPKISMLANCCTLFSSILLSC